MLGHIFAISVYPLALSFCFMCLLLPIDATSSPLLSNLSQLNTTNSYIDDHQIDITFKNDIIKRANSYLGLVPPSVAQNKSKLDSDSPHNFQSLSPYFWPNPNTRGGRPYIRKDGFSNPEHKSNDYDIIKLKTFSVATKTLAIAWVYTGDIRYAKKATTLIKAWFIDDATRMNPNFEFAELVPGVAKGTPSGVIHGINIIDAFDSYLIIKDSAAWNSKDDELIRDWLSSYLYWLQNSELGKVASKAKNNMGTWYNLQIIYSLIFLNRIEEARDIALKTRDNLINIQIDDFGRQKLELKRANSFNYSIFNLEGWFALARISQRIGVDLWHYSSRGKDQPSNLYLALKFVAPYFSNVNKWPFKNMAKIDSSRLTALLILGSINISSEFIEYLDNKYPGNHIPLLLFPRQSLEF